MMGTKVGIKGRWFLAGKRNLAGQPNTFTSPFLDASKITENTILILNSPLKQRTTAKWDYFIAKAQEEWEEVQAHALENIQENLGDDDYDDEEDAIYFKGELTLSKPPAVFSWKHELTLDSLCSLNSSWMKEPQRTRTPRKLLRIYKLPAVISKE